MTHDQRNRKNESNRIESQNELPRDELKDRQLGALPQSSSARASEGELDVLLNSALDAEARGDLSASHEAWARIAAMDEQRRRSASLLSSGLTQLREPASQATAEVSARVLAGVLGRINLTKVATFNTINKFTMPEAATAAKAPARDEAGAAQAMDHYASLLAPPVGMPNAPEAPAQSGIAREPSIRDALVHEASAESSMSTGRPWGLPATQLGESHPGSHPASHPGPHMRLARGRRRRWYQMSPVLASFVLGGLVTLGLMMVKHYGDRGTAGLRANLASELAATSDLATQSKQQLLPQLAVPLGPSNSLVAPLEIGDTSRYSQWQGIGLRAVVDGPPGWLQARRAELPRSVLDRIMFQSEFKPTWKQAWDIDHQRAAQPVHSGDTLWFHMLEEDDLLSPTFKKEPAKLPQAR